MTTLKEQTLTDYWQFYPSKERPEWIKALLHAGKALIVDNPHKEKHYFILYSRRFPEGAKAFIGDYVCRLAPEENEEEQGVFVTSGASFERRRKG